MDLSFDEILRIRDGSNWITIQLVLHLGYFIDLWCTLLVPGQEIESEYLRSLQEDQRAVQFLMKYAIQHKSGGNRAANRPPSYKIEISRVTSRTVNFNEEFTIMKEESVKLNGEDLVLRYDGSSHRHLADGGARGYIHLTTIVAKEENSYKCNVSDEGTGKETVGQFDCSILAAVYDVSVTLKINQHESKEIEIDTDDTNEPKLDVGLDALKSAGSALQVAWKKK